MAKVRQSSQKLIERSAERSDKLDRIHNIYISEATWLFRVGIIAAAITFLLFAGGLVVSIAGIATQGWIASISSTGPGLLSALFFNREKVANEKMEMIRIDLEKQEEDGRKKRDQELEDKRKKEEEEKGVQFIMRKLEIYYNLASKTDDEDQREIYYHVLFGQSEYNKKRLDTYFDIKSQMEDEKDKKGLFLDMFSALLKV